MMSCLSCSNKPDPLFVVFLHLQRVLIEGSGNHEQGCKVRERLRERFGEKPGYSDLEWRIVKNEFLFEPAVANFEHFIQTAQKVGRVGIVLFGGWAEDGTVEDLKNRVFPNRAFSKLIIDKTADDDCLRKGRSEALLSPLAHKKYKLSLGSHASYIKFWLLENREKFNVKNFVVICANDIVVPKHFPNHSVVLDETALLSKSDATKAYQILVGRPYNFERSEKGGEIFFLEEPRQE